MWGKSDEKATGQVSSSLITQHRKLWWIAKGVVKKFRAVTVGGKFRGEVKETDKALIDFDVEREDD